jgi:16S rRNA (uracil1498-N3)-methyltransferase
MRLSRFLVPGPLHQGQELELPPRVGHHVVKVLRLRAGDALLLTDGEGAEFAAELCSAQASVRVRLGEGGPRDREAPVAVTLVQALFASDRLEWMIEKAVELGAAALILAPAERSGPRAEGERAARRLDRWREIAAMATCQSGRTRCMPIELHATLASALSAGPRDARRRILAPGTTDALDAPPAGGALVLAIGPEGGWSPRELDQARALAYRPAGLGPRVLRAETAGPAALAGVLAQCGGWQAGAPSGRQLNPGDLLHLDPAGHQG